MIEIPSHIRALIFDLDGTIADTMPLHFQAWVRTFGEHGREFSERQFYEMAGMPTAQIIELLNDREGYGLPVRETALRKDQAFEEMIEHVTAIEPIVKVVRDHAGRLPMAVASGGTRSPVSKTLAALGLEKYFPIVVTADDVEHGKPAPDMFLEAARRMGIAARDCCVFEDGDLGLEAAEAAHMMAIDVRPILAASTLTR